jgi:hypothetical protein
MENKPYDHAFQYKDIPTVPETFADGVHLLTVDGSTMRIVFTVSRSDAEQQPGSKSPRGQKATAARLVMPLKGFAELYNKLDQMVSGLESQGLLKRERGEGLKATVQ